MSDLQEAIFMALLPVSLNRGYSPAESAQMALSGIVEIEATIALAFPNPPPTEQTAKTSTK